MRKTISFTIILFLAFVCYSDDSKTSKTTNSELDKTSLQELSQLKLNSIDVKEQISPKAEEKKPEIKRDAEYWDKQLETPLLDQAKKEKEEQAKKQELDVKEQKSVLHKIVYYLPNRLLDFTDIISFKLGFGPEASMILSFTKYFEFGGSYGDNYFIENGYNRQYGGGYHGGSEASVGWANWGENYTDYTFGYTKPYVINERQNGIIPSPSEEVYKNGILDFWKIGVHVGWLANVGVEIHPVAIANFITGFAFIRLTDTEEL